MFRELVLSFFVLSLLVLSGCAEKTTVILLPDPDGKVGQITVSSKVGAVDLTQAGEATVISDRESVPSPPSKLSQGKIIADFSQALSVLPSPPVHFILYFKNESTELTTASNQILPEVLETIDNRKSKFISVIGHTDTAGDLKYNMQLSHNRAKAVKILLINKGIDPALIDTESHGENNPLVATADNVHEPKNRRVEVVVR